MSRWGDDIDEELKKNEKVKAKFMINFKSMNYVVQQIEETTKEWLNEIREYFPGMEILCDNLSLGISCHVGEGGLGIGCSCRPLRG